VILVGRSERGNKQNFILGLTCQSDQTNGVYTQFYYVNSKGENYYYGTGYYGTAEGLFLSCHNDTFDAFIECDFGTPWTFKVTILNPVHNRVVFFESRGGGHPIKNTSTTIFVQGIPSSLIYVLSM
jgi:hypothetical protein